MWSHNWRGTKVSATRHQPEVSKNTAQLQKRLCRYYQARFQEAQKHGYTIENSAIIVWLSRIKLNRWLEPLGFESNKRLRGYQWIAIRALLKPFAAILVPLSVKWVNCYNAPSHYWLCCRLANQKLVRQTCWRRQIRHVAFNCGFLLFDWFKNWENQHSCHICNSSVHSTVIIPRTPLYYL